VILLAERRKMVSGRESSACAAGLLPPSRVPYIGGMGAHGVNYRLSDVSDVDEQFPAVR